MADGLGYRPPQISTDPLGLASEYMGILGGYSRNILMQQEIANRQAIGELSQRYTNPNTGQRDDEGFAMGLSTDPRTAPFAPAYLGEMYRAGLINQESMGARIRNEKMQLDVLGSTASELWQRYGREDGSWARDPDDNSKPYMAPLIDASEHLRQLFPQWRGNIIDKLAEWQGSDPWEVGRQVLSLGQMSQQQSRTLTQTFPEHFQEYVEPGTLRKRVMPGIRGPRGEWIPTGVGAPTGVPGLEATPGAGAAPPPPPLGGAPAPSPLPAGGAPAPTPSAPAVVHGPGQMQEGSPFVPGGGILTKPSPFETARSVDQAKYSEDLAQRSSQANLMQTQLSQVQREIGRMHPGGGALTYKEVGMVLQALGANPDTVNAISDDSLAVTQYIDKLFTQLGTTGVAQVIHQAAPGSRLGQQEWVAWLNRGSPTIEMDRKAIDMIMGALNETANYTRQESRGWKMYQDGVARGKYPGPVDVYDYQTNKWPSALAGLLRRREAQERAQGGTP